MILRLSTIPGSPHPLGVTKKEKTINFALYSEHAKKVTLLIKTSKLLRIPLDPHQNKTKHVWHIGIKNLPHEFFYAYSVDGPHTKRCPFDPSKVLSDPYARLIDTHFEWEKRKRLKKIYSFFSDKLSIPFNWEDDIPPNHAKNDLIIYEMHVRGFTIHRSSQVRHPGTFSGIINKIDHLKKLGVNAIELMPIFEFDENEIESSHLYNYWGYSPLNFFQPMRRYGKGKKLFHIINEFKTLVKELHREKIEVILDVVYNHTAEKEDRCVYFHFRGIDNPTYYLLNSAGDYKNFSGCGNTFNCNHPASKKLILDSLRYWVSEMHVDGFRFDLASILTRDEEGMPLDNAPLIRAIAKDPILSKVKLIVEPWDAKGLYQTGNFISWGPFSEWNDQYRDSVRRFIKGTPNQKNAFAAALCGSEYLYKNSKTPTSSINFITAHDGFTLNDLVSYLEKHNELNEEENRDGTNANESWNCGIEGETDDPEILDLRQRQKRNFFLALFLSQGIPMILMGDEYGHTRKGNNNTWNQDNKLNWFNWDKLKKNQDLFRFLSNLIAFRKNNPCLHSKKFITSKDIDWHGIYPFDPNWENDDKFMAFTIKTHGKPFLYAAFNTHHYDITAVLPPPQEPECWYRIIDTYLPSPDNFSFLQYATALPDADYTLHSYSSILLQANESRN